jgi:hypothetical protein
LFTFFATWRAVTWPISCESTPASSAPFFTPMSKPLFTYMAPPGTAKALSCSSSITKKRKSNGDGRAPFTRAAPNSRT